MNPSAPRTTQRRLPASTVRVSGRSSERSIISELTTPSPPGAVCTSITTTRGTVLQQHSPPLLSPHAPAEVNHDSHAAIAAREIEEDRNGTRDSCLSFGQNSVKPVLISKMRSADFLT